MSLFRRAGAKGVRIVKRTAGGAAQRIQKYGKDRRLARRPERLEAIERSGQSVVLFLSPEAGLEPFHASQVLLAKTLDEAGHAAIVLSCDGLMPMCTVKFATRTEPSSSWGDADNPVCAACRAARHRTANDYELLEISLESLVGADDRTSIDNVIRRYDQSPWTVDYDDIEFGTIGLAEVLRDRRKHAASELDESDIWLLVALLRSSLAVYFALQKLSQRFKLSQIAYFGEYAYWQPAQIMAARNGLGLLALAHGYHRDIDRRQISIRPRHAMAHYFEQIDDWQDYAGYPIAPKVVSEIAEGALYRLTHQGGASLYSPTWSGDSRRVFDELGLVQGRRTIVAYPSSYDEYVCIAGQFQALGLTYPDRPQPFADQEAWLRELVQWASGRPDLQLVLRLHPRMGVGHRHSTISSDYRKLKEMLATVPSNVVVVWPESKISSYSLAEFADAALISWSSMGLELARFGVPVVAAFQRIGPVPLSDFINFQVDKDRYFETVAAAVDEKATIEKISGAFRWTHFLHWGSLIDVSDVIPSHDFSGIPRYREPRQRALMLETLVNRADVTQMNMARLDLTDAARVSERAAIVEAIEQVAEFFDAAALGRLRVQSKAHAPVAAPVTPPTRLVKRLLDLLEDEMNPGNSRLTESVVRPVRVVAR